MRARADGAGRRARPQISLNVEASLANHAPVNDARRRRLIVDGGNTEQAFDAPDDAADRSANDGTERTGDAVAFACTTRKAAGNTLSLRGERRGDGEHDDTCVQYARFHATTPLLVATAPVAREERRFSDD